jgi:transcriptional regulator of arginine metabolism
MSTDLHRSALHRPGERRQLIRQLIANGTIHSQEQIVAELARRGVRVTQATVSRDLAALGVVRGIRGGAPVYLPSGGDLPRSHDPAAEDRLRRLLADLPLEIDAAPPLLVLRTSPGAANAIARALDLLDVEGVVGTLAGDDTIFVACRDERALSQLRGRLVSLAAGQAGGETADG